MSKSRISKPTYEPAVWRLLKSGPSDGPTNLAVDEALLESVEAGESLPLLRIYTFEPPCLTIGRDQDWDIVDLDSCNELGWNVVRQITQGRAILHTADLAFAISLPLNDSRAQGNPTESYEHLAEGLLTTLKNIGLEPNRTRPYYHDSGPPGPLGFDGPAETDFDISIGQRKLINSSQWRTGSALLQQGSFPLAGDVTQIADGLWFDYPGQKIAVVNRLGYRATTLELMLGRDVPFEEAATNFIQGFSDALNLTFETGELTEKETARAQQLRAEKYTTESWLKRT
ncbi:MAG: biotin/lipoate A/B protein ligase family protein [Candidatus Promineifilaceae bacterium]